LRSHTGGFAPHFEFEPCVCPTRAIERYQGINQTSGACFQSEVGGIGRQAGCIVPGRGDAEMAEFISNYGVWVVAAFIALESIGIPLPAEAALIAAGFFAAKHGLDIWPLIAAGVLAAILGEIVGFWIGRRFGHQLLARHGAHVGLTEGRVRIGQWLFVRYGGRFVFIARFLPVLRNMAAVLAGTNSMAQHSFYFASGTAAVAWILCYGLAAYSFGEAFENLASPAAVFLGLAAASIVLAVPALILQYEKRLLAKAERGLPERVLTPQPSRCQAR
jgi:membrane protein DedA with SNARE-associated domain